MTEEEIVEETKVVEEPKDNTDYDFDFSMYESEVDEEETAETISQKKRPVVTGLRSRFSNGEDELSRIGELNRLISKYSIKTEARTQDINELWEYYGMLSELWEIMRNIFGSAMNDDIQNRKTICRKKLDSCNSSLIPPSVHNNLLFLRSCIYRLKQLSNLGFEVDRIGGGVFGKVRRNIEQ